MKYRVHAIYTASKYLGEFEAGSAKQAVDAAEQDPDIDTGVILCHQCSDKIELNEDPYKFQAELVEPVDEKE